MNKLKTKDSILIGVTLFSMFFGAGNLIFPPFLGARAGESAVTAFLGFCVTAIGFPVLGIIVAAKVGGLKAMGQKVGKYFEMIFSMLIYISIGPLLAIPRTASTSFEIAAAPFGIPEDKELLVRVIYSCIFFGAALITALKPQKLTERLGKIMFPCLLALIAIVFVGSVMSVGGEPMAVSEEYLNAPFFTGFIKGYDTMDTIAALNFGVIIAMNIRARGVNDEKSVRKQTIIAGLITGVLLAIVYSALCFVGQTNAVEGATDGTGILVATVARLFGKAGIFILAAIFIIACFNTCTGLICCCSEYFTNVFKGKIRYQAWAVFFAVISMLISNIGLSAILSLSVPILNAIYPVAIVIITLGLFNKYAEKFRFVYPMTVLFTALFSVSTAYIPKKFLEMAHITALPLFEEGLVWVLPAVIGLVFGIILSLIIKPKENKSLAK